MSHHTQPDWYRHQPDQLFDWEDQAPAYRNVARQSKREKTLQTQALRQLAQGSVIYAVQFPDGVVKLGFSNDFAQRLRRFRGHGAVVLGWAPGGRAEERTMHASLAEHRARGREWYHPTPEVMAVVNDMRHSLGLPDSAA